MLPRSYPGFLLLLVAVAIAVWMLWQNVLLTPPAIAPVTSAPPFAASSSSVVEPEAPAPPESRTESGPPASDGLRVLVQDRARQPIAGAEITVTGGDDRELLFPPTGSDGWTRAQRMPNGDVYLKARQGAYSGTGRWRWDTNLATEVIIWMNLDRDVEVTVTDPAGAPHANTPVGLFGDKEQDWRHPSTTATTDESGIARFHLDGSSWLAAHAAVRAVAMFGSERTPAEPTAWAATGPLRITIVADRSATLTGPVLLVRFVDGDGAPVEVQGKLAWSRIQTSGSGSVEWPVGDMAASGREAEVKGLLDGDHLRVFLWEDGRLASESEVTLAPGAQREETTLLRGALAPRLEIPIVDGHGKPVAIGEFVVTVLLTGGGYEHESTLQPNADGLLVVTLAGALPGRVEIAEKRDAERLHWPVPARLKRPYRTSIGREPPPNPPLAVLEFGNCEPGEVLRLPPVVAVDVSPRIVGVVVDANDEPAAGVRIWITTVTVPEPDAFAAFATATDAQGRFAIRATSLPDEVFVCGRRPLGFCAPVRVRPSVEPVTLRLQPTGALALDLRFPERPPLPEAIANGLVPGVSLRCPDEGLADGWWAFYRERRPVFETTWHEVWSVFARIPEGGEVVFQDLVPGTYRVLGKVGINAVLDIQGVRVEAGETTRPGQAQGAVIGGGVDAGLVRVRDAQGRPVAKARVRVMLPEWKPFLQHPTWRDTDANGEAWFVVPRGASAEVEVSAQDRAPVVLQDAVFPVEVTIGAGTSLDFAISGCQEVAADSRGLLVGAKSYTDAPPDSPIQLIGNMAMFCHPHASLDANGRGTIPNLPPGNYRLWLGAIPPIQSQRGQTFLLLGDRTITVGDPAHVAIEHAVTAEEVARLLGR